MRSRTYINWFLAGSVFVVASQINSAGAAEPPAIMPQSFADVFQRVSPAVVSLVVATQAPQEEPGNDDIPFPFNQLPQFQSRGGRNEGKERPQREVQVAGSGFFITENGFIVTNNHVVEGATKITVTLSDKRELVGHVVGRDEATDLAVVKVEGTGFTSVAFETLVKPRVGDWVMAVGNPLQLGGTATAGIVSYVGRDLADSKTTFVDFLQVSAPITFGNSGGPTFDLYGRVVGVNSAIYSQNGGGGGGIGFAVPADTAQTVTAQLMAGRSIQRGYLGATIQELSRDSDEALGLPPNTGAQIAALVAGGPGEKAGLRAGDIVLAINGQKVSSGAGLTRAVAQTPAGAAFKLTVRRGGRDQEVRVLAGTRPAESALSAGRADQPGDTGKPGQPPRTANVDVLGMTVTALSPAAGQANNVAAQVAGVLVSEVREGSDAERKGVQAGDVIEQANQQPTASLSALAAAVEQARKTGRPAVFLLIRRGGQNFGVPVRLDDGRDQGAASPSAGPPR